MKNTESAWIGSEGTSMAAAVVMSVDRNACSGTREVNGVNSMGCRRGAGKAKAAGRAALYHDCQTKDMVFLSAAASLAEAYREVVFCHNAKPLRSQ